MGCYVIIIIIIYFKSGNTAHNKKNRQRTDRNTQNMQYIYNKNSKNTFTSKAKSYANAQQCDLYKNYTHACMRQQHYEVLYQN